MCDTSITPDQGTTSGSQSSPTNFNERNLALAAATARETLLQRASARLALPVDQLVASDGVIVVTARSPATRVTLRRSRRGPEVGRCRSPAGDAEARERVDRARHIGTARRHAGAGDRAVRVRPQRARRRHGARRVVRPPAVGATLVGVDERSLSGLPGLIKVVVKQNFVGVVCEKPWQAIQAARALKATWTRGSGLPDAGDLLRSSCGAQPARNTLVVDSGDVDRALAQAPTRRARRPTCIRIRCTARWDRRAPSRMSRAIARRSGRRRSPPTRCATASAMISDFRRRACASIFRRGSGCYGINGADTVSYDAAILSQAVGRPVRVQLSRQDEMAWENYGFAYVIDQRVGLDARRHDRRVGLRVVERVARRTAWLRHAGQRRHRHAAGFARQRSRREPSRRRRRPSTTAATRRRPTSPGCAGRRVAAPAS